MATGKELIYKSEARAAILHENPSLAYCIDKIECVDAVEVIRCKDCKNCRSGEDVFGDTEYDCVLMRIGVYPDGFCSYGERRNNGV